MHVTLEPPLIFPQCNILLSIQTFVIREPMGYTSKIATKYNSVKEKSKQQKKASKLESQGFRAGTTEANTIFLNELGRETGTGA